MVNALTDSHSHHPQWSPERDPEAYDDQGPLRETTDRGLSAQACIFFFIGPAFAGRQALYCFVCRSRQISPTLLRQGFGE